jgi:hypothetical protein
MHRDPALPIVTAGESPHPHQRQGTPAPHWEKKRGNLHHNKNPARDNISSILSLRKISGAPGEKNSKLQLQGHKGLKL